PDEGLGPRRPGGLHARVVAGDADGLASRRPRGRQLARRRSRGAGRDGAHGRGGVRLPRRSRRGSMSRLFLLARQERGLAVRSRWTQIFAVVFAGLALAVAASGYVLSGGHGVQDFARTAASLVQLVLLLVPLTSLLIGVISLAPDRGAAELLFSQPVARRTILLGKLLGLFEALLAAQALGFGAAGLVVFPQSGDEGLSAFLVLFAASAGLTAIFLSLAAWLAAAAIGRRRARALALALVVWFVAVVLFDVAALGLASLLP